MVDTVVSIAETPETLFAAAITVIRAGDRLCGDYNRTIPELSKDGVNGGGWGWEA